MLSWLWYGVEEARCQATSRSQFDGLRTVFFSTGRVGGCTLLISWEILTATNVASSRSPDVVGSWTRGCMGAPGCVHHAAPAVVYQGSLRESVALDCEFPSDPHSV